MFTANELLKSVNDYLDHITYNRRPASLYAPIQYVLSIGGKRIRPVLMLLAYNLYRDDAESILAPACALETYHNYNKRALDRRRAFCWHLRCHLHPHLVDGGMS